MSIYTLALNIFTFCGLFRLGFGFSSGLSFFLVTLAWFIVLRAVAFLSTAVAERSINNAAIIAVEITSVGGGLFFGLN